jgi:pyridoxine 5'-phosphate synthase PdxJ
VNIGHDIIARAVFIGLDAAVKEILQALQPV